jgi:predicted nucleic acid-binding protein
MMVIDTSVWFDLFSENFSRKEMAEKVIGAIKSLIYEPEVFKVS